MGQVQVRYYAGAAAAAGTTEEQVDLADVTSVADLREALAQRHPDLAPVLAVSTLLLDGTPASDGTAPVGGAAQVDVLPPFAGG